MDCFKKIITNYDYADRLKPGGFVIDGKLALTQIDPELVGDYVIMVVRDPLLVYVGDPAEVLSQRLENRVLAGRSGMFTTYSGYYKGAHISIVSGGSGSPEAELILVEFMHYTKANTFIRLGGAAGVHEDVRSGDCVIANGVVRDEGMSQSYVTPSYPASCSYDLVAALAKSADDHNYSYHIGIGRSQDSTASASKEITECDDAGRFAIPVHNPRTIIIINNLCVTWLEISSYRWASTSYVLAVLRTTYADMV